MHKKISPYLFSVALVASLVALAGCSSFESTIVNRNSDETLSSQHHPRTSKGVPVKLSVPSHMEVKILETLFIGPPTAVSSPTEGKLELKTTTVESGIKQNTNGDFVSDAKFKPAKLEYKVTPVTEKKPTMFSPGKNRLLTVATEKIYTDKVFTVDFPRPLSGTLSLAGSGGADGIGFDAQQYFSKIRGTYEEKTLATLGSVITGEAQAGSKSTTNAIELGDEKYQRITRVVAFERFDISECGWEDRMHAFVQQYMGVCSVPCQSCGEGNGGLIIDAAPPATYQETPQTNNYYESEATSRNSDR